MSRLEPNLYKDICHDAYLSFFKKTKTNLFDQPLPLITTVVKHQWYDNWKWKEKSYEPLTNNETSGSTPLEELIASELIEACYELMTDGIRKKRNPKKTIEILELRLHGYCNAEIAKILNITKTAVAHYTKNLEMIANPFNAHKLIIKKSITEAQWLKRIDQEDFQEEDYNEFYKLYSHKESGEGLLVKLPVEKENPYIRSLK